MDIKETKDLPITFIVGTQACPNCGAFVGLNVEERLKADPEANYSYCYGCSRDLLLVGDRTIK